VVVSYVTEDDSVGHDFIGSFRKQTKAVSITKSSEKTDGRWKISLREGRPPSLSRTTTVGSSKPHDFALYDLQGNEGTVRRLVSERLLCGTPAAPILKGTASFAVEVSELTLLTVGRRIVAGPPISTRDSRLSDFASWGSGSLMGSPPDDRLFGIHTTIAESRLVFETGERGIR
jgi:hypothetical protein